jgi:hypothetical protein
LYGVITIGAWFFNNKLVPETRSKTLEQIAGGMECNLTIRISRPELERERSRRK